MSPCAVAISISTGRERRERNRNREKGEYTGKQQSKWADVEHLFNMQIQLPLIRDVGVLVHFVFVPH
jgi:hypothetical protein